MTQRTEPTGGSTRSYRSPRRLAAARATRRRIRGAACELFLAGGYAATSMRAVAAAAGVAEKTVYLQFDTKSALLKAVVENAIVGDDEDVPAAGRDWFVEAVAQTDLDRKLRQIAALTSALHERSGAIFAVARDAAAVDPEIANLWASGKRGHRADMTILGRSFDDGGLLPPGLDLAWATTTLYVLLGPETWHLIRTELRLDKTGYHDWLLEQLRQAFRGGNTAPHSRSPTRDS